MRFIGRSEELLILQELMKKPLAVATITGRRRVGKSRLVAELARRSGCRLIKIEGRDSEHADNATELAAFAADLSQCVGIPGFSFATWNAAFTALGALLQRQGKRRAKGTLVLLDEITWLARYDESCLAELKVFIDRYINGSGHTLILCGSVSQWIEQRINDSDLFVGRISRKIRLEPLPLPDCAQFWDSREVSAREILTALCVTGGVPRYLEEIDPTASAEWNIRQLCFAPSGYMVHELPSLLRSSFVKASREHALERYLAILASLSDHGKTAAEIATAIGVDNNEGLKDNLTGLVLSGLISENPSWNLKSRTLAPRKQHYRIEDPYTRFYIKYIRPALGEIEKGHYEKISLRQLPDWETIRGLQFQCLVTPRMVPSLLQRLRLDGVLILRSGPYYQSATRRRKPAQIDYLLQTADTLYVCETKFRKHIDASVIDEVRQKIDRLEKDPGLSVRKALIYSGERAPGLKQSAYFEHQIDVADLLRGE